MSSNSEVFDLYDLALLLNYERASTEPRFRYTKLREIASQNAHYRTILAPNPSIWTSHNGPKDGFLFDRIEPPTGSEDEPDLPWNMVPDYVPPLISYMTQLAPSRLETIYWQARGHDGCFKSAALLQHFFNLFRPSDPSVRIRLADGTQYITKASTRAIIEFDLVKLKHLTVAIVSPTNMSYITGGADQATFRHAVVAFGPSKDGNLETILDMASMQFGDTGRGPGRNGKGTFVLESLDQYYDRLESIAEGGDSVRTSFLITEDPDPAYEAWTKEVAKKVKDRWEKRKENHWCGHCGSPLANGPGLKRCSGCREAYYCDREHQKMAWSSYHKRWCGKC